MATNTKMTARLAGFERNTRNRLAVKFDLIAPAGYVSAVVTSGYAFMSYGAAIKGSRRALAQLNATGRFPNMCEWF